MHTRTRRWREPDTWLLITLAAILALGGVILAAIARVPPVSDTGWLDRQALALVLGLALAGVIRRMDYRRLLSGWRWLYLANLALLLAVLVFGQEVLGARRWLDIGPLSIQPSEPAKLLAVITLAGHLQRRPLTQQWRDLLPPILHLTPVVLLVFLEPDLGTSLVFAVLAAAMLVASGWPWQRLAVALAGTITGSGLWILAHLRWGWWIPLRAYQLDRLISFLAPGSDPAGMGYQIRQARLALAAAGPWGQGLAGPTPQLLASLPEHETDFVFAALTLVLGWAGALVLIVAFVVLIGQIFRIARRCGDPTGRLLAAGVGSVLAFHVVENVGMNLGLMPVAGIPLPFVSYGGSALVTHLAAVGVVLSVWRHRPEATP